MRLYHMHNTLGKIRFISYIMLSAVFCISAGISSKLCTMVHMYALHVFHSDESSFNTDIFCRNIIMILPPFTYVFQLYWYLPESFKSMEVDTWKSVGRKTSYKSNESLKGDVLTLEQFIILWWQTLLMLRADISIRACKGINSQIALSVPIDFMDGYGVSERTWKKRPNNPAE